MSEPVPALTPVLDFLRELWALNHRLEVTSREMLRTIGVTAQQRVLLRVVQQLEPVSAGTLARALHVHPGTLSASLRRLEERELLVRTRAEQDARRVDVSLTRSGRELAGRMTGTVEAAVATVLERTPAAEQAIALQLLRALSDAMPRRHRP